MSRSTYFLITATLLFASCATQSVITTYKNRDNQTDNIHAVLVAAVIAADDTAVQNQVENYFTFELKKAGYQAVPSSIAFGPGGLANLGQEETLMKLCNYGFDAVLTVALIDESKENYNNRPDAHPFIANFYLERIWNYERIQANLADSQNERHFWECILFDLYSLRPLSAIQTRLYDVVKGKPVEPELAKTVIGKMKKERILRKRNNGKRPRTDQPVVKQ